MCWFHGIGAALSLKLVVNCRMALQVKFPYESLPTPPPGCRCCGAGL